MSKTYNSALQDRVNAHLERMGLSQNAFAKEVGVSATALSQWLRSGYPGDPRSVESKLEEYFNTFEARQAAQEQAAPYQFIMEYVATSVSQDVYNGIRFAQLERGLVVLHGDAGIGKTEGAKRFRADHPHNTVLITMEPCTGTLTGVIRELAIALDITEKCSRANLVLNIRKKLRGTNKVVVVDEAQHLNVKALDQLRALTDANSVTGEPGNGVCLIGNTEVYSRIVSHQRAQFAQLYNRVRMNRAYMATKVTRADINALFPRLVADGREKELSFLHDVARSRWGIRGAVTVFNNSIRNNDVSYNGLYSMAVHLGIGLN